MGRKRYPIPAGQPVLVPAWLHWRAIPGSGIHHEFIQFNVLSLSDASVRHCFTKPMILADPRLGEMINTACANLSEDLSASALLLAKAAGSLALSQAIDLLPQHALALITEQVTHPHPVRTLADTISDDPGADWSVAAIADHLGCTTDHATRLFRRFLGNTPARIVSERRLAAGAQLLMEGQESIDDIAHQCGFADRFSFSRAFSRHFGNGPVSWRLGVSTHKP